jgi:hypothetical protein
MSTTSWQMIQRLRAIVLFSGAALLAGVGLHERPLDHDA